jgi:hypothetical protein
VSVSVAAPAVEPGAKVYVTVVALVTVSAERVPGDIVNVGAVVVQGVVRFVPVTVIVSFVPAVVIVGETEIVGVVDAE